MATQPFQDFALRLHPADTVAVLKRMLRAGDQLAGDSVSVTASTDIPPGHKIALREVADGEPVIKYGQIIGVAKGRIAPGDHVHTHNLVMHAFERQHQFGVEVKPVPYHPPEAMRFFQGFARAGGQVGTRNYVAVVSVVNCSASVSRFVAEQFPAGELRRKFPNVDGVVAFTNKTGCGLQPGEPLETVERVFTGMMRHPNVAACVVTGLGCEVSHLQRLRETYRLDSVPVGGAAPVWLNIQDAGGVRKTVDAATAALRKLLPLANAARRTRQPLSKLVLATNCGGSDGNSGITANPALGVACDELVRYGGTAVLAETPEIYGAEHLLTRRAVSREVGEKLVSIIRWWENHVRLHGASIDNNPSPGNKAGGLTTIYEKSLGAVAKGGQSPLAAVFRYAEPITASGFCFMDTPGFDPVSMTGLIAGGCNVGVFTTGRGSVYGCKPSPCIKVATHTPLFRWMNDDMDLNAGTILDGQETVQQVGLRLFEEIIAVADGRKTKSEQQGIGDEEFAPWVLGPTF
ncbi:MAG: altronate dehydratase [Verrucomicrobia bacterium]|nr:altronate dehydratase [Verrucomicrobiota bacterium]